MKFKLDENLGSRTAWVIAESGHDSDINLRCPPSLLAEGVQDIDSMPELGYVDDPVFTVPVTFRPFYAPYLARRPPRFGAAARAAESALSADSSNTTGTCRNCAVAARPLSKVTTCAPSASANPTR